MNPHTHIDFLDRYCKNEKQVYETLETYNQLITINDELGQKEILLNQSNDKKELLDFQLNEIESINPQLNEDETLTNEFKRLNNIEETIAAIQKLNQSLTEHDHSIYRQLYSAIDDLEKLSKYDDSLAPFLDSLKQSSLTIQDTSSGLIEHLDYIENDSSKLNEVHDRLQSIESLKRKYGGSIESVLQYVNKIQEELEELKGLSQKITELKDRLSSLTSSYNKLADELSRARIIASKKLSNQIEKMMNQLNMEGAIFKVEIKQNSDHNSPIICGEDKVKYGPKGYDIVEFYLSANPGESIKPLAKIASGGEVSRIMLSIKSVLKEQDPVATLIFDEIDAGISGEAAEKVAKALKSLSVNKQVVCITHLPQIASIADNHLFVGKKVVENKTYVHTQYLDDKEKVEAVAKLFSGEGNIDQGINSKENFISRARG